KAATVEGKLTSFKGTSKVSIDGTSYDIASLATTAVDSDFETSFTDQIGESYILYTIGGIVYAAKQTSEGAKNYAVVESNNGGILTGGFDALEVKILKADGSEVKVEVHKDSTTDGSTKVTAAALETGALIKYSDVDNGKIKITKVVAPTQADAKITNLYNKDTKSFNSKVAASDAVLFVNKTATPAKDAKATAGDFYTYTARNMNSFDLAQYGYYGVITDDNKVVAAYATLTTKPSGASSDTVYGIVSKENGTTKVDDTTYTSYTVDVDTNTQKTVLIEGDDSTLKEGYLVSFDEA
ncbi:hypothetical protein, partial [Butyricicoccus sp. AF18-9LB]